MLDNISAFYLNYIEYVKILLCLFIQMLHNIWWIDIDYIDL